MSRRLRRITCSAALSLGLLWTPVVRADETACAPRSAWQTLWFWLSPAGGAVEPAVPKLESRTLEEGGGHDPYGRGPAPAVEPAPGDFSDASASHDPFG